MNKKYLRPLVLILLIGAITWFYLEGGNEYLHFKYVKEQLQYIQNLYLSNPLKVGFVFCSLIVLLASLSIPGSIVLTILAGSIFGVIPGTFLVVSATTFGATIAFLMARFLFKDAISRKFDRKFRKMNKKIKQEGLSYLFTLRLIPASPFVVINLIMGLTPMPAATFAWVTFVGMFPGTMIYVYAGRKFGELESVSGIMSFPIILCLLALSIFPYIAKKIILRRKASRAAKKENFMNEQHEHRNKFYTVDGVEFVGEDQANFRRGPGSVMIPDEVIQAQAAELLYDHAEIDSDDIELMVEEGRVYLRGSVESKYMKILAQETLEKIQGVKDVINQLNIRSIGLVRDIQSEVSVDPQRDEELKSHKIG